MEKKFFFTKCSYIIFIFEKAKILFTVEFIYEKYENFKKLIWIFFLNQIVIEPEFENFVTPTFWS